MKTFYQVVYREPDGTEVSQRIFGDIIDAWLHVMDDCENDRDIAHLLERVSTGQISIKTLEAKEL